MSDSTRLSLLPDRDLATRYWEARGELDRLRAAARGRADAPSGEELAGAFQRIRELDALCEQLWRESQRRAKSGIVPTT